MEIKKLIIPNDWVSINYHIPHGWGNGYVGVPSDHPWYGKYYDSLDVTIHGGLTYSDNFPPAQPEHASTEGMEKGYWWVGFDTMHYMDNLILCPRAYVEYETDSLYQQAQDVYDPIVTRVDSDYRSLDQYL